MSQPRVSRRSLLQGLGALAASRTGFSDHAQTNEEHPAALTLKTFWGDLHNHNNIGYAQGSLRRSFEIAREHLDFFAFTSHAWWNDIAHYENNIEQNG